MNTHTHRNIFFLLHLYKPFSFQRSLQEKLHNSHNVKYTDREEHKLMLTVLNSCQVQEDVKNTLPPMDTKHTVNQRS